MFKQILIPVDFSEQSTAALRLGADMAGRFRAAVTVLHVYDPLPFAVSPEYEQYSPEQRKRLAMELEKALSAAKQRAHTAGAMDVQTKLLEGNPPAAIAEFAAAGHFDLIVMGTHGRRGLEHALLGSVAERVVRTAPCPVLAVRPEGTASEAAKIWPPAR